MIGMAINRLKLILRMIKFEHTIFALPFALMSAFIAAEGVPSWHTLFWILMAMVSARSAAMAFNRVVDVYYDSQNPRTKERELPKGLIKMSVAWLFIIVSGFMFIFSAFMLNRLCFILAPFFLLFLLLYSYSKRFTWASHLWLGVSLGLAPLGAWIAVQGEFALLPVILGIGVSFWVAGFDIIYACLDYDFDKGAGLYSIPRIFGVSRALFISALFHVVTAVCFLVVGWMAALGVIYMAAYCIIIIFLVYQHLIVKPGDLSRVQISFFTMNGLVSMVLSIAAISEILFKLK